MPKIAKRLLDQQTEWEQKINRAKAVRKNWADLFMVEKIRQYLDGKQKPEGVPEKDWITVNLVYAHLKSALPTLYSVDPYFYMKVSRSFTPAPMLIALYEQRAKIRQGYLNYLKKELDLKKKARLSIQDAMSAYGVLKTRYRVENKKNPDAGSPMAGDDGEPMIGDDGNPLMEPDLIPYGGAYDTRRIHPDDFLWDEDAGPLEDTWCWVAERVRETLGEMKKNPLFSTAALNSINIPTEPESDPDEAKRQERKKGAEVRGREPAAHKKPENKKDDSIIIRWEIYNIRKKTWLVIAEDADAPLIEEGPLPPGVECHPYSILMFTHRDDSPYPIPPMSQMIPLCDEYNRARSDIQKHRKRFNRKYWAALNMEDEEIEKLAGGEDGTVVKANEKPEPIQDAQLDQMRFTELGYLRQEIIEVGGGQHEEARGIAGADSATQAGILDKRLEIKEGDALAEVIDFITTWARKMDQLVQTHIDREEAINITGPQGDFWMLVRQQDYEKINGEFEYTVNVGATMPRLPQMERASWLAFLGLLGNFPQIMLSKRLMKQMAELHHIEDEAMIDEIMSIAKQMMSGAIPMPNASGSQPNVGESRPVSAMGGQAGGGIGG